MGTRVDGGRWPGGEPRWDRVGRRAWRTRLIWIRVGTSGGSTLSSWENQSAPKQEAFDLSATAGVPV